MVITRHLYATAVFVNMVFSYENKILIHKLQVCCWSYFLYRYGLL